MPVAQRIDARRGGADRTEPRVLGQSSRWRASKYLLLCYRFPPAARRASIPPYQRKATHASMLPPPAVRLRPPAKSTQDWRCATGSFRFHLTERHRWGREETAEARCSKAWRPEAYQLQPVVRSSAVATAPGGAGAVKAQSSCRLRGLGGHACCRLWLAFRRRAGRRSKRKRSVVDDRTPLKLLLRLRQWARAGRRRPKHLFGCSFDAAPLPVRLGTGCRATAGGHRRLLRPALAALRPRASPPAKSIAASLFGRPLGDGDRVVAAHSEH